MKYLKIFVLKSLSNNMLSLNAFFSLVNNSTKYFPLISLSSNFLFNIFFILEIIFDLSIILFLILGNFSVSKIIIFNNTHKFNKLLFSKYNS